jgi:hypothetical protein
MNNIKIINLTPHDINVIVDGDVTVIRRDGTVARVNQISTVVDKINGIPVSVVRFGDVVGLPDPVPGVIWIVSALVKQAVNRSDVVSPGELVRNSDGNVIGCKGFFY